MAAHIDISDRKKLNGMLSNLQPQTRPRWGTMEAQQMIEHLVEAVAYTNGKKIASLEHSEEFALREKLAKVHAAFEIPKNVTGPLPDNSGKLIFKDLATCIIALNEELDRFEKYFATEGQTSVHGAFGPLTHEEWVLWHGKHFAHHFRQFGLLDE